MYIMVSQGPPCKNSVSFFPNSVMVLARPAELRKASALKVLGFLFPFARFLVFMAFTLCHGVRPSGGLHIPYHANRNESRSMTRLRTGLPSQTQNRKQRQVRRFHSHAIHPAILLFQAQWLRLLLLLRKFALKTAFNILTTDGISCFGQYDRIDDLIPRNLRGDKRPVLRQFLVDEFYFSAVFTCFDPLFV